MFTMSTLAPTLIAGVFAIVVAITTSKLTLFAERKKFERDLKKDKEIWSREFSIKYAEAAATNKELADRLSQQFASAFLYIKNPESSVSDRRFIPSGANVTIGSDPACDITIPNVDGSVTRKHAMLESVGGNFELTDLHSTSGTVVNGQQIKRPTRLKDGSTICFGRCEALFVSVRQP